MATSTIKFACTSLSGTNKVGELVKDAMGYYTMVVGALNMYNTSGAFYDYQRAKDVFSESSQLMRRVSRGALRGEYGHPKPVPGMSSEQFSSRVMQIREENTCCQFKEIWLDFDNYKDDRGNPIIAILAKVIPSGPLGHVLQKQLDNPGENVCFSIRSFTEDSFEQGRTVKVVRIVVTFDYVNEPGMSVAQKWNSPALEGLEDTSFSRSEIMSGFKNPGLGVSQESMMVSAEEIAQAFNWGREKATPPAWANW